MLTYLSLCQDILDNGFDRKNERTGEITRSVFARQLRFDLKDQFPILHAKFTAFKTLTTELIWFLSGSTNIKFLTDNNCHIWDEWADENGDLGPCYGSQWRIWAQYEEVSSSQLTEFGGKERRKSTKHYSVKKQTIDQIADVIQRIKNNPSDRRLLVVAYNVGDITKMALPPCHYAFQFFVNDKKELSCMFNMRSTDVFLGLPFNIASYALLTHMVAQVCKLQVGELIFTGGDCHLYENHFEQTKEMLSRPLIMDKAQVWLNHDISDIDDFKISDIRIDNYKYHPKIKAPVAI